MPRATREPRALARTRLLEQRADKVAPAPDALIPTLSYELGEGERILIRRALADHAQHWTEQLRQHKAAGNAYDADFDKARLEAIARLSDKILKGGRRG